MRCRPLFWLTLVALSCDTGDKVDDLPIDPPFDPELDTDVEPEVDPGLRHCEMLHPHLSAGQTATVATLQAFGSQLIGTGATSAHVFDAFLLDPASGAVTPLDAPDARDVTVVGSAALFVSQGQLLRHANGQSTVLSDASHDAVALWTDGTNLVYLAEGLGLYRVATDGGPAIHLSADESYGAPPDYYRSAEVHFAADRIVYLTEPEDGPPQVVSVDLDGQDLALLSDPMLGLGDQSLVSSRAHVEVSPDGTEVLIAAHISWSERHLLRVDADGTDRGPLHPDDSALTIGHASVDPFHWLPNGSLLYPRRLNGEDTLVLRRGTEHISLTNTDATVLTTQKERVIVSTASGLSMLNDDVLIDLPIPQSSIREARMSAEGTELIYRTAGELWGVDLTLVDAPWPIVDDHVVERFEPGLDGGVLFITDADALHHVQLDGSNATMLSPPREHATLGGRVEVLHQREGEVWFNHDTTLRQHAVLHHANLQTGEVVSLVDVFPPRIAEDVVEVAVTDDAQTMLISSSTSTYAARRTYVHSTVTTPCEVEYTTGYNVFFTDLSTDRALINGRRVTDAGWTYLWLDPATCAITELLPNDTRQFIRAVLDDDHSAIALAVAGPEGPQELFAVDADGSNLRQLSNTAIDEGVDVENDGAARFAADGEWVVFAGEDGSLYSARSDGSEHVRLYDDDDLLSGSVCTAHKISADGQHVLFAAGSFVGGLPYRVPVDGSSPPTRIDLDDAGVARVRASSVPCADISIVGERIVFKTDIGVFTTDADGQNPLHISDYTWADAPRFIDDHLVYATHTEDGTEIHRVPLDGSSPTAELLAHEDRVWARVFLIPNRPAALGVTLGEDSITYWVLPFEGEARVLAVSDGFLANQVQMFDDHMIYRSSAGLHKVHFDTGEDTLLDFRCGAADPASWTAQTYGERLILTGAFRAPGIVEVFEIDHTSQ